MFAFSQNVGKYKHCRIFAIGSNFKMTMSMRFKMILFMNSGATLWLKLCQQKVPFAALPLVLLRVSIDITITITVALVRAMSFYCTESDKLLHC